MLRLITACVVLAAAAAINPGAPKPQRPDVFVITIDTLRSDHVHCYGYEKIQTPAMDALATQGIRFAEAFTPSPITTSSHASIFTGLLPSSHGVRDFGAPLAGGHATLAELLQNEGYQTAAFIGAVILDSRTLAPGFDRGFQFYDNFPKQVGGKSRWGRLERRAIDVVQHAENWLSTHRQGSRFVWMHLYDPHDPYEPPAPFSEIYKDRLYDGEIAYADSGLGQFLAFLKRQGWYDAALIVLSGDHGEGLGEHHENTHGIFLYDSTTHVPLIVKQPQNQDAGRVLKEQVRTTDILPTVLDILRLPIPNNLDGASLKPILDRTETASRAAPGETDYPLRFGWASLRSMRTEDFKFIEAPQPELYDLRSDPGELHNSYVPWDTTVQQARQAMAAINARESAHAKPSPAAVSPNTVDELRALGYLGAADARSATDVPEPSLLPDPKDKIEEQNLLHVAMMASEDAQTSKARDSLTMLLQMDPTSLAALVQLGELEMASGNYGKALEYCRRAHELRPEDAKVSFDYGRALSLTHDFAAAREALQESLKANPNQPEAQILLAQVYFRLNNRPAATDQLAGAVISDPGNPSIAKKAAQILLNEKEFNQAVQLLEAITESSRNAQMLRLLAQAYRGAGRAQDAHRAEAQANTLERQKKD